MREGRLRGQWRHARLVEVGHKLIVASYCDLDESDVRGHRPKVVLVDAHNVLTVVKDQETQRQRV